MVAAGEQLVRADRLTGYLGVASGQGVEPTLELPELPPIDLDAVMLSALAVDTDDWTVYEARIRAGLEAGARVEWATQALAGFTEPRQFFRLWRSSRREHTDTERLLWGRLVALSHLAPKGASLEELLTAGRTTLGRLMAEPVRRLRADRRKCS